jgi:hypothetical protein
MSEKLKISIASCCGTCDHFPLGMMSSVCTKHKKMVGSMQVCNQGYNRRNI